MKETNRIIDYHNLANSNKNLRYRAAVERILKKFGRDQKQTKENVHQENKYIVLHTMSMSLKLQLILNANHSCMRIVNSSI